MSVRSSAYLCDGIDGIAKSACHPATRPRNCQIPLARREIRSNGTPRSLELTALFPEITLCIKTRHAPRQPADPGKVVSTKSGMRLLTANKGDTMTDAIQLPIEALILARCAALKLRRPDLVRRAGYKNVAKGLRRLDVLCAGELKATTFLIAGLPAALELPTGVVADAIHQTEQQIAEMRRIAEQELD